MKLDDLREEALILWYGSRVFIDKWDGDEKPALELHNYDEYDQDRQDFIDWYVKDRSHLKLVN